LHLAIAKPWGKSLFLFFFSGYQIIVSRFRFAWVPVRKERARRKSKKSKKLLSKPEWLTARQTGKA